MSRRNAKEKKPSMKRRCAQHDYHDRGIYMLTLCIEGRRPLLGRLCGNPQAKDEAEGAHVELSALGERVKACWEAIPLFHPQIEVMRLCIMPDHIHGVLFVHEKMEKHLGQVVAGFKTGCNKAARELGIIVAAMPPHTEPNEQEHADTTIAAGTATAGTVAAGGVVVACPAAMPQGAVTRRGHYDRQKGALWEAGYNDRVLFHKGQLPRMLAYLDDNPRRLLLKRLHPEYFSQPRPVVIAGTPMQSMGNHFLLDIPLKLQVQCSRHLYDNEIEQQKEALLDSAIQEGAVIVSPCISRGEQHIASAALAEGIPLIVLLLNGFPPFFKPKPRYLEACTNGRLLMLAPFTYQTDKIDDMRRRCLALNSLAATICADN